MNSYAEKFIVCDYLPPGHGQLFAEVSKNGICEPEVALTVFKVNGVDFVGHGGGANFSSNCFLWSKMSTISQKVKGMYKTRQPSGKKVK